MAPLTARLAVPALLVFLAATPSLARSTSQFQTFYPSWNDMLNEIIRESCSAEKDAYEDTSNESRLVTLNLTNCMMDNMNEFHKTEMSITAVLLGLLPTMLQLIGPTSAEVGLLALRRPILALLLGIAMPSVTPGGDSPAAKLIQKVDVPSRPGLMSHRLHSRWFLPLLSAAEYAIAAGAVFNVIYQAWQLAYWSISVSAIAVPAPNYVSETYAPFLWNLLVIPVHFLACLTITLHYKKVRAVNRSGGNQAIGGRMHRWIGHEVTPCAYGKPLVLRENNDRSFSYIATEWLLNVMAVFVFVYGTVALSSQIFISLTDVVPVIARYMLGTIACRLVLRYELYGMRDVSNHARIDERPDSSLQMRKLADTPATTPGPEKSVGGSREAAGSSREGIPAGGVSSV